MLLAGNGQESTRWLRGLLESGGYAVLQERSGQHALERARATEPDVILVDAELPDMPGVELCRTLRADPRVSSSTPILMTIRDPATRAQRLNALRAGAWECIAPPHDADEILLKIGAYVHAKLDADRARTDGLLDPVTGLYNRQGLARRARELGSQAFREHGPLACIVLALDLEPVEAEEGAAGGGSGGGGTTSLGRCIQAIKAAARLSDVIGRLSTSEFAVLITRKLRDAGAVILGKATLTEFANFLTVGMPSGYSSLGGYGFNPYDPRPDPRPLRVRSRSQRGLCADRTRRSPGARRSRRSNREGRLGQLAPSLR